MKRTVIGIDPGLRGAIAVLNMGKLARLDPMPIQAKRRAGHQVHVDRLMDLAVEIREEYFPVENREHDLIAIERSQAMPRQGVSTMFQIGDSFGCVRMFAAVFEGVRIEFIAPSAWKSAAGLGTNKGHSITLAHRLYPASRESITLKKHEGIAEALLIAHHAYEYL